MAWINFAKSAVAGLGLMALVSTMSAAEAATLVTNGGFDGSAPGPYGTLGTGSTAISGWTVTGGTIDWISTYWDGTGAGADNSIDLSGASLGTISQTVTGLVAGQGYQLAFDIARNSDFGSVQSVFASLGGLVTTSATATTNAQSGSWTTILLNFVWTGGSSANLTFAATTSVGCCYGPALDSVSLTPVPVPPAAALLLTGLAGLGVFGRRRKVNAA